MTEKWSISRKPGLAASSGAIVAALFVLGLFNPGAFQGQSPPAGVQPAPAFEVASIKPNHSADMFVRMQVQPGRFTASGVTTRQLITLAYDVKDFQVTGGPGWINSDKYDIEAKEPDALAPELPKLPPDERRAEIGQMMQTLLADRFKLKVSRETKDFPVYALVVAKNGPKLHAAKPGDTYPNGIKTPDGRPAGSAGMMQMAPGQLTAQGVPMATLTHLLSQQLGRDVTDQTGLKGSYDFTLKWTPDQPPPGMGTGPEGARPPSDNAPPPPDPSGPSIFTALQEQLGLKLDSTKGPVEILIVDHVEKPSED